MIKSRQLDKVKDSLFAERIKEQIQLLKGQTKQNSTYYSKTQTRDKDNDIQDQLRQIQHDIKKLSRSVAEINSKNTHHQTYRYPNQTQYQTRTKCKQSLYQNQKYYQPNHDQDSHQVKQCMNWTITQSNNNKQNKKGIQRQRRRSLWKDSYDDIYSKHENIYKKLVVSRR